MRSNGNGAILYIYHIQRTGKKIDKKEKRKHDIHGNAFNASAGLVFRHRCEGVHALIDVSRDLAKRLHGYMC